MIFTQTYPSPVGNLLLAQDEEGLIGCWFEGQKYFGSTLKEERMEKETLILDQTKEWLDAYFQNQIPANLPKLHILGTDFQKEVWKLLLDIPYGEIVTYGYLSKELAKKKKMKSMSAQAVGSAVGHNPISILVPCHRVVGTNGKLTGYAAGLDTKQYLLELEHLNSFEK